MEVNLTDWLGDNSWAIWLSLAFLLGVAEIMSLDLVLIMLAVGALAGAVVAVLAPSQWWLQILAATGISIAMLLLLRPTLLAKVRNMPGYRSSAAKMVGSSGVAMSQIDRSGGEIKVDPDELEDARWFPRGELPGLPSRHSISRFIIDHYGR